VDQIGTSKPNSVSLILPNKAPFKYSAPQPIPDHRAAFLEVLARLADPHHGAVADVASIAVVGHRVVHGGDISRAAVIDPQLMVQIRRAAAWAPLHNPANIVGIETAQSALSHAAHVAVFDTAFHQTMPPESYTYALPRGLAEQHGLRRYGFHGSSYKFILQVVADGLGRRPEDLNLVVCHLGSGASMACIQRGRCVDTTMGMTPLEGMVMGTRCGDIDPGVVLHLSSALGMSTPEVDVLLNKESGMKGLCGMSDFRDLERAAMGGDEGALMAERVFVERVRKYLGSYLVRLEGELDALVFTGGVGENSPRMRGMICRGLTRFGISVDPARNVQKLPAQEISPDGSPSKVLVVPTNEELSIALQAVAAVAP